MAVMPGLVTFVVVLTSALGAHVARAQDGSPPERPVRGLFGGSAAADPDRLRHESTFQMTVAGGYESNLPPADDGLGVVRSEPSGYLGASDAALRYWLGHERRSFEVGARGYVNALPSQRAPVGNLYGGEIYAQASTALRRGGFAASHSQRYDPRFELIPQGLPVDTPVGGTPANPANVLIQTPSRASTTAANLTHQWSARTITDASMELQRRTFVDGAAFSSRILVAVLAVDQSMSRAWTLQASYRHSDGTFVEEGGRPLDGDGQRVAVGLRHETSLSPARTVVWTAGAGATHVDTARSSASELVDYWAPSGYASASLPFGRSWNVTANYQRSASVLPGITAQSFVGNEVAVRAAGFLQRRVEGAISAGYVGGRAGAGSVGRYDSYSGEAQVRIRLARWWSTAVTYNYFGYESQNVAGGALGNALRTERHTLRVGLDWSLPLYGSF